MKWIPRIGWGALTVATLAIAIAAFTVKLPGPKHALVLDHATYLSVGGEAQKVTLPHSLLPDNFEERSGAQYNLRFNVVAESNEPLLLYVPSINRNVTLIFNGELIFDSRARALWSGPLAATSVLVQLPRAILSAGINELTVVFEPEQRIMPTYLSAIYLGTEAEIAPNFRLHVFLQERLRTIVLGAQVLLAVGVLIAFCYRPRDPLFAWLAGLVLVASLVAAGVYNGFFPSIDRIRPWVVVMLPTVGMLFIGVALVTVGKRPPRLLSRSAMAAPLILLLPMLAAGRIFTPLLMLLICLPLLIGAFVVATAIVARGALREGSTEVRLMLSPFFLMCCFAIRDIGINVGFLEGAVPLAPYVRALFLAATTAVLMRRLAVSLHELDHVNENLNLRLAEREEQLAILHHKERMEATRLVREHERQRLTHDLHDGISGHLISIIALSERVEGSKSIEQAARNALDDLRLVIYSLDIGDRDLPLALANFRERLIPQLQRIGVELDWSTAHMPEVSGVTPGNALTVLRILQEAITNALKHGPAHRITIRGAAAGERVAITVENDGQCFVAEKSGFGLQNMRRRANQLCADIRIEPVERGTRLTLLLPYALPDVST
jgi:signal transduction histidine kinase